MTGGRGADRTLHDGGDQVERGRQPRDGGHARAKAPSSSSATSGLKVERAVFYRKEIDLLMSTSYGPGRYDPAYEVEGHDYPFAYVRWTLNRNMQAYLELVARGRIELRGAHRSRRSRSTRRRRPIASLRRRTDALPLGVLIRYPDDARAAGRRARRGSRLRGHRRAPVERINYALVGAGAFGTAMLVPQMRKRRDRFFLRGVVSRSGTQGSNFARDNQVEILTSDLDAVLSDPGDPSRGDRDAASRARRSGRRDRSRPASTCSSRSRWRISWDELERVVERVRGAGATRRC